MLNFEQMELSYRLNSIGLIKNSLLSRNSNINEIMELKMKRGLLIFMTAAFLIVIFTASGFAFDRVVLFECFTSTT